MLPKSNSALLDLSFDTEKYIGYWDPAGKYHFDPVGYQYRLNIGYAYRLSSRWQTSVAVPYVWNENQYQSGSTHTSGLGDTALNLWYEAFEDTSAWKIREFKDWMPSLTLGPSLLIPTGISPYDSEPSSYDITGRGFYRIDGNVLVAKTLHPWTASVSLAYGTYIERPVNREYGKDVQPYRKKMGDRSLASCSLGYIYYIGTAGDALTGTLSFSHLNEDDAHIDGSRQHNSGFQKNSFGAALAYSSTDGDWSARVSWNHSLRESDWGRNFPTTDIYTMGVSYGFR